jgi:catechol 2,3-dioxygenase-like lactoylglutathione lyase family enzyme
MVAGKLDRNSRSRLLYHVSVGVRDMPKARGFYETTMAAIGCRLLHQVKDEEGKPTALGWGRLFPELWINVPLDGREEMPSNGAHVALFAADKAAVDLFHSVALSVGGSDDGAPGYRREYQPGYYAAFVRDPDGNKLEVVWLDTDRPRTALI